MNNLPQIFSYNNQEIRTIQINGETWFVAQDVCRILELGNVSQAVESLDDDERNTISIRDSIRGNPNKLCISEPGLYGLIFSSRKPEAKDFKRWITHKVIPSIRKTGAYSTAQPKRSHDCIWTPKTQEMVRLNKELHEEGYVTIEEWALPKVIYVEDLKETIPHDRAEIIKSVAAYIPRWFRGERNGALQNCKVSPHLPWAFDAKNGPIKHGVRYIYMGERLGFQKKKEIYCYPLVYVSDLELFWEFHYIPYILPVYLNGCLPDGIPRVSFQLANR